MVRRSGRGLRFCTSSKFLCEEVRQRPPSSCGDGQMRTTQSHKDVEVEAAWYVGHRGMRGGTRKYQLSLRLATSGHPGLQQCCPQAGPVGCTHACPLRPLLETVDSTVAHKMPGAEVLLASLPCIFLAEALRTECSAKLVDFGQSKVNAYRKKSHVSSYKALQTQPSFRIVEGLWVCELTLI